MGKTCSKPQSANKKSPKVKVNPRLDACGRLSNCLLVWVDANFKSSKSVYGGTLERLQDVVTDVAVFTKPRTCVAFLREINYKQVFVITSSRLAVDLICRMNGMLRIHPIYIFDAKPLQLKRAHKGSSKIKGAFNDPESLCDAVGRAVRHCQLKIMPMSFFALKADVSSERIDQLEPTIMLPRLYATALLDIKSDDRACSRLVEYCRKRSATVPHELIMIDQFARDYRSDRSIWWYTREFFIHDLLNEALSSNEVEIIVHTQFIIHDLHLQIAQLHKEQTGLPRGHSLTVYRGQQIRKENFENLRKAQGGMICFRSFLSGNTDRNVAFDGAQDFCGDEDDTGVLFVITMDAGVTTTPFARIEGVSYRQTKGEILFSMCAMFRVDLIKSIDENDRLFEVHLVLTPEVDQKLAKLTETCQKTVQNYSGWTRVGQLLVEQKLVAKAQWLFTTLLEQTTDLDEQSSYYHQLACIHDRKNENDKAISFYEKALEIRLKTCPEYHPDLADFYGKIAALAEHMGQYSKAVVYYEKLVDWKEKMLPSGHPDLVTVYNRLGMAYTKQGEQKKALTALEKAVDIKNKTSAVDDSETGNLYNNIGLVLNRMGEYSQALSFLEKSIHIHEAAIPVNHQNLGNAYDAMGIVYQNIKEHARALPFHEKALDIRETKLDPNHPHLALSYINIGKAYKELGEYSTALPFFRKALAVNEKAFTVNHPELCHIYESIGCVYGLMQEHSSALAFHERALKVRQATLAENDPKLAESYAYISETHEKMGDYSTALTFLQKAVAISEETHPNDHPSLAGCYNNIGLAYGHVGDHKNGLLFLEKAVNILLKSLPPNHPKLAVCYNNIGIAYARQGDYSEGLSFCQRALSISQLTSSSTDPELLRALKNIEAMKAKLEV